MVCYGKLGLAAREEEIDEVELLITYYEGFERISIIKIEEEDTRI